MIRVHIRRRRSRRHSGSIVLSREAYLALVAVDESLVANVSVEPEGEKPQPPEPTKGST